MSLTQKLGKKGRFAKVSRSDASRWFIAARPASPATAKIDLITDIA
ncbi:MAG: hypothetical protein WAL93_07460 [Desulfobacterales bacterium]